jgi:hypothetical protein
MADEDKWRCDYCTFDNWSSAVRCTMCRAATTPKVIEAAATEGSMGGGGGGGSMEKNNNPRNSSSTDIYREFKD